MPKLTRRGFLGQTSAVGVATLGVLTAVPGLTTAIPDLAADTPEADLSAVTLSEPIMAHVSDLANGEISLLVGTREVIFRDPQLIMRLLNVMK